MSALQSITNGDIDLGTVESAIAWVHLPRIAKGIQGLFQLTLRSIPGFDFTQETIGPCRQLQFEREAKDAVDVFQEFQTALNFIFYLERRRYEGERLRVIVSHLRLRAEDMRIILLEATHTCQAAQRSRRLVTVQHTEVSHAQWQFTPRAKTRGKHHAETKSREKMNSNCTPCERRTNVQDNSSASRHRPPFRSLF